MGLFDSVVGSVLNNLGAAAGTESGGNPALQMVMGLMRQNGGLGGLVDMLARNGLGSHVASWVGTGANQSVSPEQLSQALGSGPLAELAAKFGLDSTQLSGSLAQYLPEVVNQLTPEGRLPDNADNNDLVEQSLASLAGKLFG